MSLSTVDDIIQVYKGAKRWPGQDVGRQSSFMVMPLSTVQVRMTLYKGAEHWPGQGVGRQPSLLSLPIVAQETCSAVTPLQTLSVARFPPFLQLGVGLPCPNGHALIMARFGVPCCSRSDTCQPSVATSVISLSVLQGAASRRARTIFMLHFIGVCLYRTCCGM